MIQVVGPYNLQTLENMRIEKETRMGEFAYIILYWKSDF